MDSGSKVSSNEEKSYHIELENGLRKHQSLEEYEAHLGRPTTTKEKERWQQITAQGTTLHTVPTTEFTENPITFSFVMTMMGFSMTFIVAEVVPLFMITLFTVIAYDLGAGNTVIWLVASEIIAVGAIVPFVGIFSDLLGRKGITMVSLCMTVVSMIIIGVTPNIAGFIAGQVIGGMAIGIQLLTTIAAVTELVPVSKRGITIGYIVMGFTPMMPASLYGQFVAQSSWRYVAVIIGGWAAIALVIITIFYHPPPRVNSIGLTKRQTIARIDHVGAVLAISGVVVFLIGLNWGGQDHPWSSPQVISTLTVGLILLVLFLIWEKFGAKYTLFPSEIMQHKKLFFCISFLCLTSGINYIPLVIFWVVQCYTVYYASYEQAGTWLLPIGFCIAGGAIISAVLMTVFKKHIHLVLLAFCVIQTIGLGSMAAVDPNNINTVWAPLVFGLLGVGGVLLPSQVVFSIISPDELIGSSVALSIVIRSIGQVIGISMFYNIFIHRLGDLKLTLPLFVTPVLQAGITGLSSVQDFRNLITALSAGPFEKYAYLFPGVKTEAQIHAVQVAGHNLYQHAFPKLYFISIAFGGAAIVSCFFLRDIKKFIHDGVAVQLAH